MTLTDLDFEQIRQLFSKYSQTLDFGDAAGFVDCFTEDGVLDTSASEDELRGIHQGRDALGRFVAASAEYSGGRLRQSTINPVIEGLGSKARATSYAIVTRGYSDVTSAHGQPGQVTLAVLTTTGMSFDDLEKTAAGWRFARRVFRHDGLPDVLDRLREPLSIGPR